MASDGDMFAQRKVWGYNRLCAAICDNSPTAKLVEIETQNIGNMLGNGYAVPSLKASVSKAFQILESSNGELGLESPKQRQTRLIETIRLVEREFVDAPSAVDVAKIVLSVGLKILETGAGCPSKEEFEKQCCAGLGDFWIRRFGWESFAPYVMARAHLDPQSYQLLSSVAREQAIPEVAALVQTAMTSPGGRLSKRRVRRSRPIRHTAEALREEFI